MIVAGLMMALTPGSALRLLSLTASSQRVNLTEQIPRLLVGAAMVLRSDASKAPQIFEVGGYFIVLSSIILLLIPLPWHSGYAIWWSRRISPAAVRLISPFSAIGGAGLIYAAW